MWVPRVPLRPMRIDGWDPIDLPRRSQLMLTGPGVLTPGFQTKGQQPLVYWWAWRGFPSLTTSGGGGASSDRRWCLPAAAKGCRRQR
ncbi:hypothetical protein Scep_021821 [Stephania cephalantha]|uniref:Uncharacterized protein n=1 Tax=Stephania cephalantha TaxID=152367 RepID=A0AAP0F6U5_9MAGN